ncbi:hypothetical protein FRB95_010514 [Tulasnella sp. JGI-2019a]|nr:hypothetical protein FRB95_010514 [Tulasnella sp. JGI-2019a]
MTSIFLADEDDPLSIYIQGDIDVEQVMRLKALVNTYGGAAIDSSESANVIVIIDRTSQEGVRLIRNHTVQPGEKMCHAVVDQAWIAASIEAGEILVEQEWGGHLIRAPRARKIDDILQGRRPLPGFSPSRSHQLPPPQAGISQAAAGSPISYQNRHVSSHPPQGSSATVVEPPLLPQHDAAPGLATPPLERRYQPLSKSTRRKGKAREVEAVAAESSPEDDDTPPTPPAEDQKLEFPGGKHLFTDLENRWINSYRKWGMRKGMPLGGIHRAIHEQMPWHSVKSICSRYYKNRGTHPLAGAEGEDGDAAERCVGTSLAVIQSSRGSPVLEAPGNAESDSEENDDPPPPPSEAQKLEISAGKYRYTELEIQWVKSYLRWASQRRVPRAAACRAIQKGIPWHTLNSIWTMTCKWGTHLGPVTRAEKVDHVGVDQGEDMAESLVRNAKHSGGRDNMQKGSPSISRKGRPPPPRPPRGYEALSKRGQTRYPYTPAEKRWAIDYANWLLEWEPETTMRELCVELHKNMRQHPETSWHAQLKKHQQYYIRRIPRIEAILTARRTKSQVDREKDEVEGSGESSDEVPDSRGDDPATPGGQSSSEGRRSIQVFFVEGEAFTKEDFQTLATFVSKHWDASEEDFVISEADWSEFSNENPDHKKSQWRQFHKEQIAKIEKHVRMLLVGSHDGMDWPSQSRFKVISVRGNTAGPSDGTEHAVSQPGDEELQSYLSASRKITHYTKADRKAIILFLVDNRQAYYPRELRSGEKYIALPTLWRRFRETDPRRQVHTASGWMQYHRSHAQEFQEEADRIRAERDQEGVDHRGIGGTFDDPIICSSDDEGERATVDAMTVPVVKIEGKEITDSGDQPTCAAPKERVSLGAPTSLTRLSSSRQPRAESTPIRPLPRLDLLGNTGDSQRLAGAGAGPSKKRKAVDLEGEMDSTLNAAATKGDLPAKKARLSREASSEIGEDIKAEI